MSTIDPVRRKLLRLAAYGGGLALASPLLRAGGRDTIGRDVPAALDNLQEPDENGLMLPKGFSSRIVAQSGREVATSGFRWHDAPDGGACFPAADDGWIYVSNSEIDNGAGGASALRFAAGGDVVDAYPILQGSNNNCAGGPTPWGTWLSCEEVPAGRVWECDPFGNTDAKLRPALGIFEHEAAAVDPATQQVYLTEDHYEGLFYRFTPEQAGETRPDLSAGRLEAAEIVGDSGEVRWHPVPDPLATTNPTRKQANQATRFVRGEGAWYHDGKVYFCTTGDNRVHAYDIKANRMDVIYDAREYDDPVLTGNDNITVASDGTLLVAEDGGNMQIVTIDGNGVVTPLLQVTGHPHSEITGPAFSPDGSRLYFSSQRGASGRNGDGITFEVLFPGA